METNGVRVFNLWHDNFEHTHTNRLWVWLSNLELSFEKDHEKS